MKNLEKILNSALDKLSADYEDEFLSQSEWSDNALETSMEICEKHLPYVNESKDKRQIILFVLADNPHYCLDLVDYYYGNGFHEDLSDTHYLNQFRETLSHDLLGLYNKDEHFVPRINNKTD